MVNWAANPPSSGYEEMNQRRARSHTARRPAGSLIDVRAPPATSTASVAAWAMPAAKSAGQS
jgi:hypothetical protein